MIGKLKATTARTYIDRDKLFLLFELPTNLAWEAQRCVAEAGALLSKGKSLAVTLDKWTEKRSNDANSYAWLLLNKLSGALGLPPVEVYRRLIRDVPENYKLAWVPDEDIADFRAIWEDRGLGWQTDIFDQRKGQTRLICYYGSSYYNTTQMSRLIDLIIQECQQQGIETLPPDKLAALVEDWDK